MARLIIRLGDCSIKDVEQLIKEVKRKKYVIDAWKVTEDQYAAQQSVQADVLEWCGCEGHTPTMENGKCSACGKNAHR